MVSRLRWVYAAHTGSSSRRTALENRAPWSSAAWHPWKPGLGPQAGKQVKSQAFIAMPLPVFAWAAWLCPVTPQIAHGSVATARRYASERTGAALGMGAAAVVLKPMFAALGTTEFIARRALSMRRCSRSCSVSGVVLVAARRKGVRRIIR